jgi:transposase-like protein
MDEYSYKVKSQTGNGDYNVISSERGWQCSCPDSVYRREKCKHIFAVEFSLAIRDEVAQEVIIKPVSPSVCIYCNSDLLVKFGLRHNDYGDIQKFRCKTCSRHFSINLGFEKMKSDPKIITTAMQLYFSGESLRNTAESLLLMGVKVSHVAVYKWIHKYVTLMERYVKLKPKVGNVWRADELYVKIKGNMKYVYALMDDDTRFWIAKQVADSKHTEDIRPLLRKGKEIADKKPQTFITDGACNFHEAYLKEYWTIRSPRVEHIQHIRLQGDIHNNKIERMNGEIRDREKVMRGLKRKDTSILTGYQIFHNYVRPHEGLKGKTPAEVCGIKVEGENKWLTLIQNADHNISDI